MNQPAPKHSQASLNPAAATPTSDEDMDAAGAASESFTVNREHSMGMLASYRSEYALFGESNVLGERFEIDVNQPDPAFSTPNVPAFAAKDRDKPEHACVAYIVPPHHPYDRPAIDALEGITVPHMVELLGAGVFFNGKERANAYAIMCTKPQGVSLSHMMANKDYIRQSEVLKKLIAPIVKAIVRLHELGIVHGNLSPDMVYIDGDKVTLCHSMMELSGTMQPLLYQPAELVTVSEHIHGGAHKEADIYALAMLVLDAIGELDGKYELTREQLTALLLTRGAYISFVNESVMHSSLIDFFRGTLLEAKSERWDTHTLMEYVRGKRYNLIPLSPPRESQRAHRFGSDDFYTRRALAQALRSRWDKAAEHIKEGRIPKWLDSMSVRDDSGDRVRKASSVSGKGGSVAQRHNDMIARVIMALDPQGPISCKELRIHPSAMPALFCRILAQNEQGLKHAFMQLLQSGLVGACLDARNETGQSLSWDSQGVAAMQQIRGLGFGTERMLYDMNPQLPCLSPTYTPYYINSAKKALRVLDVLAYEHADKRNFVDAHLIAFLAAKVGISKDMSLPEFRQYPAIGKDAEMQALLVLARAQEKLKMGALPGLTHWFALRVNHMLEHIHSAEIRRAISRDMQAVLPEGKLALIIRAVRNKDYLTRDHNGHRKACEHYHKNNRQITRLQNQDAIQKRSQERGLLIAFYISLVILFIVVYMLLKKYAL